MRFRCHDLRFWIVNQSNVQGLGSLPTVRLERRTGRLSAEVMEHLKNALAFALDIERASE